jgi:hypothetical protein
MSDEMGDWLIDAGMRNMGLEMVGAVEAAIDQDNQPYGEGATDAWEFFTSRLLAEMNLRMLAGSAMNLVYLLVAVSDDPKGLLARAQECLNDRPLPPLPLEGQGDPDDDDDA